MSPMAAATDARRVVVVEESAAGPGAATEIGVKPLATDGKHGTSGSQKDKR